MRIIIINFTRFGDTLQSQPLLHALKAQGHTLAWLCLENFASAVEMLDGLDAIFPFPSSLLLSLTRELDQNPRSNSWHKALSVFENFAQNIENSFKPEAILNLTPINIALLTAKRLSMPRSKNGKNLPSKLSENSNTSNLPVLGFGLDDEGHIKNSTVWASYIQAVTLNRISSPFNISDGFTLLGVKSLLNKEAQNPKIRSLETETTKEVDNFLHNLPIENANTNHKTRAYIGFQLGASNEIRQWDIKHFAKLSQIFVNQGYTPVLLGTKEEEHLAEQFYIAKGTAKNAIGKTNLKQLAALLEKCKLLITNDTGTMHLAAAVKTPIIGIFLATAQPWDTGPVSADACLIEPNLPCHPCDFSKKCSINNICRTSIPPKIIAEIALGRLEKNSWQKAFSEHARIWQSMRDEEGFLTLKPLDIIDKNQRFSLYSMQRTVYKEFLHLLSLRAENIKGNAQIPPLLPIGSIENKKLRQNLDACLELFFLLEQQGKLLTTVPRMKQAFLATNQKILINLKDISYLVPLARMWEYGMESYGDNLDNFFQFIEIVKDVMENWKKSLPLE